MDIQGYGIMMNQILLVIKLLMQLMHKYNLAVVLYIFHKFHIYAYSYSFPHSKHALITSIILFC